MNLKAQRIRSSPNRFDHSSQFQAQSVHETIRVYPLSCSDREEIGLNHNHLSMILKIEFVFEGLRDATPLRALIDSNG